MATQTIAYQPAAGRAYIDLTSWTGDIGATTTPVAGDQIEGPDTLTLNADGTVTGADGTYTLRHIQAANGTTEGVSYQIGTPAQVPQGTVTLGTPTVGQTTIDLPFTYNDTDQTGFEYRVDGGPWSSVASPVELTGLTEDTPYLIEIRAVNAEGGGTVASTTITTGAASTISSATATVTYDVPAGTTLATLAEGFDDYAFQESEPGEIVAGWQLVTTVGYFDSNGDYWLYPDEEPGVSDMWFIDLNGVAYYRPLDTSGLASAVDTTPDPFTVTPLTDQPLDSYVEFSPIEVTGVDAGENIPVTVTGTSVEYAVDAGSGYGGYTSTITNVQLGYFVKPRIRTATEGSAEITGSVDIGGESSGLSATTVAAVPQSVPVINTPTTTKNSVSASFTYSGSDATGFEARIGAGSWSSVTSPLTISSLSASFTGTLEIRAVNATGAGSSDSVQFTTDALEPPVGVISFGTPSKTNSTITQPYTYSASDQTGFEQSINNGSWVSSTSPVSLSGLPEKTFVNISVRPVNADGAGQTYTTSVQTNAAPDITPPTISIADVNTRDLTPTITGFCGDATSITLVVTGVGTYNPTNNQGTFSVQLPELTVGTYEMTLDAEDSLGNASEQQTATLTILEPLPPRGNAFGLRDMDPSIAAVTLMSNDDGACEMDEFGRFTTTNAYSVVDVDMDGIQRKVLVKADGRPIKPFYKVNWQILD
ncbi:MAG: hypothetical protein Tp1111DCM1126091_124 [Prokaryotic dsDNA virus sp.]|nr:MAG: hypothetical protein Tp1111DCM1126091_124 [Prokaryotic dsDNA virus sp.]|tara:strand:- start:25623 stop:27740 length:2118 start_codon:yes stop_codon:yes gene_type:complete